MSSWHDVNIDLKITKASKVIPEETLKRIFLQTDIPDDSYRFSHNYDSFSAFSSNRYHISYSASRYFDYDELFYPCKEFVEETKVQEFSLSADIWNEGSGGNYSGNCYVEYHNGNLNYKYYDNYDCPENDDGTRDAILKFTTTKKLAKRTELDQKNETLTESNVPSTGSSKLKAVSIDFTNKVFVSTGLDATDETFVRQTVENAGGIYKSKFVKSIDYLIYNPYYNRETSKMKDAKALKAEGKKIEILTFEDFKSSVSDGVASDEDEYVIAVPMEIGIGEKTYEFTMNFSVTRVNRENENEETDTDKTSNTNSSSGSSISDYLKKFSELEIDYTTGTLNKMPITLGGKVIIPDGVKVIAENACKSCNAEEILLPDGLVKIEANAFEMGRMKKIMLPDSLESIGKKAFSFCEALTEIKLPVNIKKIDGQAFEYCKNIEQIEYPLTCKLIGKLDFYSCEKLKKVVLPTALKKIPKHAFSGCKALETVIIQEGVETIEFAFYDCECLKEVTIPRTVTAMDSSAFPSGILLHVYPDSHAESVAKKNNIKYDYNVPGLDEKEIATITKKLEENAERDAAMKDISSAAVEELESPEVSEVSLEEKLAARHAEHPEWDPRFDIDETTGKLNKVTRCMDELLIIPEGVNVIGEKAFSYTTNIKKIVLPNGLKKIETNTFEYLFNLETVILPDTLESIGKRAFNLDLTTGITLPNGLKKIDGQAFEYCRSLESLEIPAMCKITGKLSFSGCDKLKKVVLPKTLKKIPKNAFSFLELLETVVIQEGVETIEGAFYKNPIKELTIPSSVTYMEKYGLPSDIILHVYPGSYAESFAKENSIQYDNTVPAILEENIDSVNEKQEDDTKKEANTSTQKTSQKGQMEKTIEMMSETVFTGIIDKLVDILSQPIGAKAEASISSDVYKNDLITEIKTAIGIDNSSLFEKSVCSLDYASNKSLLRLKALADCQGIQFSSLDGFIDSIISKNIRRFNAYKKLITERDTAIWEVNKEITKLKEELSHLGLFHGKRKKEIQELLPQLTDKISGIQKEYSNKIAAIGQ